MIGKNVNIDLYTGDLGLLNFWSVSNIDEIAYSCMDHNLIDGLSLPNSQSKISHE